MRMRIFASVLFLFLLCASQIVAADGLKLSLSPDSKVIADVLSRVGHEKIRDAVVFREQSFRLSQNGAYVGALVTGRGLASSADGGEKATCFLAFAKTDGTTILLQTVGAGDWETESCIAVVAVGFICDQPASGSFELAVLHRAASPNASVVEPVVFPGMNGLIVLKLMQGLRGRHPWLVQRRSKILGAPCTLHVNPAVLNGANNALED